MIRYKLSDVPDLNFHYKEPIQKVRKVGYSFSAGSIHGLYLLDHRNYGKELLIRLKDSDGLLLSEIDFWATCMSGLLVDYGEFTCVSYPPSSEKREYYLAGRLAEIISNNMDLPLHKHFINNKPRQTKANIAMKLAERKDYSFIDDMGCGPILMVDDAISTRKTALACLETSRKKMFWLFLYASKKHRDLIFSSKL